jgi:XTP/dITP diphosphohydrolase
VKHGTRVLVATRSEGKLRELAGILHEAGLEGVSLAELGVAESPDEDGIECHSTFEDNALAKARYFNRLTGMPAIADDSGLCVDALGGAPGVYSKRFSGRDDLRGQELDDANNAKLLNALSGTGYTNASYSCAAAFVDGADEYVATGSTSGRIIGEARGEHGFGYDPYFFSDELDKTFGEATTAEKQAVSHRARAFRSLAELIQR